MASKTMIVPLNSGFSASVPAPAEPILDCAHAVAMALTPIARAAAKTISTFSMISLLNNVSRGFLRLLL
jgi:hypothetical protein